MKVNVKRGRETVKTFYGERTEAVHNKKDKSKKEQEIKVTVSGRNIGSSVIPDDFDIKSTILRGNNVYAAQNKVADDKSKDVAKNTKYNDYVTESESISTNSVPKHKEEYDTSSKFIPEEKEEDLVSKIEREEAEKASESKEDILKKYEEEYGDVEAGLEPMKKKNIIDNY